MASQASHSYTTTIPISLQYCPSMQELNEDVKTLDGQLNPWASYLTVHDCDSNSAKVVKYAVNFLSAGTLLGIATALDHQTVVPESSNFGRDAKAVRLYQYIDNELTHHQDRIQGMLEVTLKFSVGELKGIPFSKPIGELTLQDGVCKVERVVDSGILNVTYEASVTSEIANGRYKITAVYDCNADKVSYTTEEVVGLNAKSAWL